MGKGSARRPMDISQEEYDASYERMFGKRQRRQYVPPPFIEDREIAIVRAIYDAPAETTAAATAEDQLAYAANEAPRAEPS